MSLPQKHRLNKKPVPVNPLYRNFIDTLEVSDRVKAELRAISPSSYTGL